MAKVQVLFYSMYGHVYQLAQAEADGVREVKGVEAALARVPELMSEELLKKSGAWDVQQTFAHIPVLEPEALVDVDAILVGTPTRFGNMAAQMRSFWDRTGPLWQQGKLLGKLAGAFVGIGTQHGGHETTITSIWHTFAHLGMVIVPLGYPDPAITRMDEITGGGPYGATTMSDINGSRQPSANELQIARIQGRRMAELALRLAG